jgi:hypothetical protein
MKRMHIERIDLHLRGVAASTAQDAARLLGPALARALANTTVTPAGADVDAGRLTFGSAPEAPALAAGIAARIAQQAGRD